MAKAQPTAAQKQPQPTPVRGCDFPGCDKPHKGRGLCDSHYVQKYRRGERLSPINNQNWTQAEIDMLRMAYAKAGTGKVNLSTIALAMGRSKPNICRKARSLGLTNKYRTWHQKRQPKFANKEELRAAQSAFQKKWLAENPHPRGMLGKKHTPEVLTKVAESSKKNWWRKTKGQRRAIILKAARTRVARGTKMNPHGSWKAGWRVVGGRKVYFRSRWEANYARYLDWLKSMGNIADWHHEPETFWFDGIKRGCVSYLPDFKLTNPNGSVEYHEVKGWMDARSKTKIKRMAKYYPKVKLVVIDSKSYHKLAKQVSKVVGEWE